MKKCLTCQKEITKSEREMCHTCYMRWWTSTPSGKEKRKQGYLRYDHSINGKNKRKEWRSARKKLINEWINSYKQKKGCVDCGIKDWRILDFDHLPQFTKIGNISYVRKNTSLKKIKEEIKKCEIRCSNCHRIKTIERRENVDI